jgi:hypothetical protein
MLVDFAGGKYILDDKTTSSLGAQWSKQWTLNGILQDYKKQISEVTRTDTSNDIKTELDWIHLVSDGITPNHVKQLTPEEERAKRDQWDKVNEEEDKFEKSCILKCSDIV